MKTKQLLFLAAALVAVAPSRATVLDFGSDRLGATLTTVYDDVLRKDSYESHLTSSFVGKIFSQRVELATSGVNFSVNTANQTHVWGNLKVRTQPIASWDRSFTGNGHFETAPFFQKQWAADAKYTVGSVGVTLSADASVTVSAAGDLTYAWSRNHPPVIHASIGPVAEAEVDASGGISVWLASAGVEGSVKLAKGAETLQVDTIPRTGGSQKQLDVKYNAVLRTESTDGKLSIFVKVGKWIFSHKKSWTVGSFHGGPRNLTLSAGKKTLFLP